MRDRGSHACVSESRYIGVRVGALVGCDASNNHVTISFSLALGMSQA
jgi:hypothetical protein